MKILITGGAGYIGTALISKLRENTRIEEIIIYDNLSKNNFNVFLGESSSQAKAKVKFIKGDILDTRKLQKEILASDIIYHLAAKVTTPLSNENPHQFDQINNWGTAELSYIVEESNVSKLINASSLSVYGASDELMDLDTDLDPRTFYGISKLNGEEHISRINQKGLEVINLRMGNVYGYSKGMRFDSVINRLIFEAHFNGRVQIFGNGDQRRSFIHIDRLSQLLHDLAFNKIKASTYNALENSYSINEIVDQIRNIYPELEMVFVNQNMKMRSLEVREDYRLKKLIPKSPGLKVDLEKFKMSLNF